VNTRYDTDHDLHHLLEPDEQDREISLSTATILGIFFALALLCAVFFGFGYSMGRKSAQPSAGSSEVTTGSGIKGSSGSLASTTVPASKPAAGTTQTAVVPMDSANDAAQPVAPPPPTAKPIAPSPGPNVSAEPASRPVVALPVAATVSPSGTLVVQVAAMSHQEDADVVAVDLKRRGYTVAVRREPQDKLFHVQIGPFATKREADGMRQRLQTDGYNNAIVK
jgi:cell division septation protein DedD